MEDPLAALYRALQTRLLNADPLWGARVYSDLVPTGVIRPYVIVTFNAGGETNNHVHPDANIVLIVKCVAETLSEATRGAGRIHALLNDADMSSNSALGGGPEWIIKTSTAEQKIHYPELVDGAKRLIHSGNRYRFNMESV
jgi:hypothetical protein